MSKSLKKLIDINRLREFKNKLVGTGSAYVQTTAVDQTIAGTKTFSKPIVGSVTGSSGSCTGNAATATKAVSADSATNASHATSADKATKAEKDGNGNNIVASYVAAGSEKGSTTDIGAFMAARPSFIKSFTYNDVWTDAISMRHRNGGEDGSNYGTYIRSSKMTGVSNLLWNHQYAGNWQGERTLIDSANLADFIKSAVTSLDASKLTGTASVSTTGNAATATKLQTARTINGTSFNGTANITTANWGTARDITIADSTGDNTGEAVSVNGSAAVTLKLPATIKANLTGNCSGSSGSCTGNAATATTATTAKSCTGNAATATKLATARSLWGNDFDGSAAITGKITGTPAIELMPAATANHGGFLDFHYNQSTADYTSRIIESASGTLSINNVTITTEKVVTAATFNGALKGNVTGNCSGSSGSCTGNAATATKLAAKRTIALSGAATGTATGFDGSDNITIPVTALASSAIRAQWYAAYPDGAEAHNSMWGGRDITAAFNNGTFSTNVANGTFRDIFPGDYITKSITIPPIFTTDSPKTYTVNWVVADCDYWWHKGDKNNGMETHHVVIVPQVPIFNANMNNDNVTTGGYAGSWMYSATISTCATGIVNAFGANHILTFRDHLSREVNTSAVPSGITVFTGALNWSGAWYSQQCNLMSEAMVYDGPHCASSALDNITALRQMSAFRLSERLINYNRQPWWLRDVVSSTNFATVGGDGSAATSPASGVGGVRPFALLR